MTNERLFHFALAADWEAAKEQALWAPASLESEGFVHLSFAAQLQGTLDTHYSQARAVILLELGRAELGDDLKLERSRGDALFPHLYRAIRREEFIATWVLQRDAASGWVVPHL